MSSSLLIAQKNLAANVRAARKAMNMSQEELAFRAGIDRTYASQIERSVANPSLGIICALSDVLGQSADQLLRAPEPFHDRKPRTPDGSNGQSEPALRTS